MEITELALEHFETKLKIGKVERSSVVNKQYFKTIFGKKLTLTIPLPMELSAETSGKAPAQMLKRQCQTTYLHLLQQFDFIVEDSRC